MNISFDWFNPNATLLGLQVGRYNKVDDEKEPYEVGVALCIGLLFCVITVFFPE